MHLQVREHLLQLYQVMVDVTDTEHDSAAESSEEEEEEEMDPYGTRRITIWNKTTQRKMGGQAAPMRRTLPEYLAIHTDCEVYVNQDGARRCCCPPCRFVRTFACEPLRSESAPRSQARTRS